MAFIADIGSTQGLLPGLKSRLGTYPAIIVGIRADSIDDRLVRSLEREGFAVWQPDNGLIAVTKPRTNPAARFFLGERGYAGSFHEGVLSLSPAG